jgi:hypothetical protein
MFKYSMRQHGANSMAISVAAISDRLQNAIKSVSGAQRPAPHRVKDVLHGTPLRHPARLAVVSIPIDAFTVANVLDGLWLANRSRWRTRG